MRTILPAVREVVEEAIAYAKQAGSLEPPAPKQLATKEDAIAAIRAGVWWSCHENRCPRVPLGTKHVQRSRINTAPIAVLSSILISPGAARAELVATEEFIMPNILGKVPKSDSVHFWTSPTMQKRHGYTIEGVKEDRLVYHHRPS